MTSHRLQKIDRALPMWITMRLGTACHFSIANELIQLKLITAGTGIELSHNIEAGIPLIPQTLTDETLKISKFSSVVRGSVYNNAHNSGQLTR